VGTKLVSQSTISAELSLPCLSPIHNIVLEDGVCVVSFVVIPGLRSGRGVGVGLGGKSGLVCVWCKSGCKTFVRMSLVLSLLLTPPILMPFSM
jgi:hypothetical protein